MNLTFRMLQHALYAPTCLVIFITAVCLIFLLKLKWPKNKSVDQVDVGDGHKVNLFHSVSPLNGRIDREGYPYRVADAS